MYGAKNCVVNVGERYRLECLSSMTTSARLMGSHAPLDLSTKKLPSSQNQLYGNPLYLDDAAQSTVETVGFDDLI